MISENQVKATKLIKKYQSNINDIKAKRIRGRNDEELKFAELENEILEKEIFDLLKAI